MQRPSRDLAGLDMEKLYMQHIAGHGGLAA